VIPRLPHNGPKTASHFCKALHTPTLATRHQARLFNEFLVTGSSDMLLASRGAAALPQGAALPQSVLQAKKHSSSKLTEQQNGHHSEEEEISPTASQKDGESEGSETATPSFGL